MKSKRLSEWRLSYTGFLIILLSLTLLALNCKKGDDDVKEEFSGPGKALFTSKNCVACHNFGGGDSQTGPDLKGVTTRREAAWLVSWLKDPAAMLKKDKIAKEMAKKFPNSYAQPCAEGY